MKKVILTAAAAAMLAIPSAAIGDQIIRVDDPTPGGQFSGETGPGYVAVYDDGVVACNQNEGITRPDNGEPLVGYIWIGPDQQAENQTYAAPGGVAGAGNDTREDDPETEDVDESQGPCHNG